MPIANLALHRAMTTYLTTSRKSLMQADFDETEIVTHNPPGCTWHRIIWLIEECDVFSLNILRGRQS